MTTSLPTHPETGLQAIGFSRGKPIFPVMGADPNATPEQIAQATANSAAEAAAIAEAAESAAATADTAATGDEVALNEFGYPDGVPVNKMAVEHQAAYWKRMSRKHETRAEQAVSPEDATALRERIAELENAQLSEQERATNEAIAAAVEQGRQAATAELLPVIQDAQLRGYASTVIDGARLDAWAKTANVAHFLAEDGSVNGSAVVEHLTALFGEKPDENKTPAPTATHRNFGQGAPIGNSPKASHRDAGLAEATKRFPQKTA